MIAVERPVSLETAVLSRSPKVAPDDTHLDYFGFDIATEFVVGYGLDYDGRFRNLPHIVVRGPEYAKSAVTGECG